MSILMIDIKTIPTFNPKVLEAIRAEHAAPDGPRPATFPRNYRDPAKIAGALAADTEVAMQEWQEAVAEAPAKIAKSYFELATKSRHCHIAGAAVSLFEPRGVSPDGMQVVTFQMPPTIVKESATDTDVTQDGTFEYIEPDFSLKDPFRFDIDKKPEWKTGGPQEQFELVENCERFMLRKLISEIEAKENDITIMISAFNADFDLSRLQWRCARLGLSLPFSMQPTVAGKRASSIIDPMTHFGAGRSGVTLREVCEYLGIEIEENDYEGESALKDFSNTKFDSIAQAAAGDLHRLDSILRTYAV